MKKLFLVLPLIIFSTMVNAQFVKLGFATDVGPALNEGNNLNFGFDVQADFRFTNYLAATASVGGQSLTFNSYGNYDTHSFAPMLAGIKLNKPDNPWYIHAQFGFSFSGNVSHSDNVTVIDSGGIGYNVSEHFDISGKYIGYHMSGEYMDALVLRLSYNF